MAEKTCRLGLRAVSRRKHVYRDEWTNRSGHVRHAMYIRLD